MNYEALKAVIESHPQWPTVTDADLLIWLKDPNGVTRDRATISARDIYEVVDPGKFNDTAGGTWWAAHININGGLNVTEDGAPTLLRQSFLDALKAGNQTAVTNLIPEQVSREVHNGVTGVRIGDIEYARTI